MVAAPAPTSPAPAPVVPFPLPRAPALDRPAGMRGSRLPHDPETVAVVRLLYERTTLRHREIAKEAGVSKTSVQTWALSGGWTRPAGAAKRPSLGTVGLPSPALKGRVLARRLREVAENILDGMEQDGGSVQDCQAVLHCLKEAKLLERPRRPRRPLAVRARAIAERYLDELEKDPQADPTTLAWVLKMLEVAREEEAALHPTREPKPAKEPRLSYRKRMAMFPSPHLPEVIERHRAVVAESRGRRRRAENEGRTA